jgi:peptidoglycan/xylan/chitin deacetylase (PgdA/CDA1 family)
MDKSEKKFEKDGLKQELKRAMGNIYCHLNYTKRRVVILNYHSVNPEHKYSVRPVDFEEQIKYLTTELRVVSLSELFGRFVDSDFDEQDYAAITFDDGYEDNYTYAFPIMEDYGVKAALFVVSGFINGDFDITENFDEYKGSAPLSWGQINEMISNGVEIGSHSHTHRNLAKIGKEELEEEINSSKEMIEKHTGREVSGFAYPWGQANYFNGKTIQSVKDAGYKYACSTMHGGVSDRSEAFVLPRIRIDPWDDIEDFKAKISGRWDFIKYIEILKGYFK